MTIQQNLIISNVLSDAEIYSVYEHINNTPVDKTQVINHIGHRAYHSWLPQSVVDKLTSVAQSTTKRGLELRELSFARYSHELSPRLQPHLDSGFKEQRLTFDLQIGGNVLWPISVEGSEFTLENNQALTFAGTHQIHWRPKTTFLEGQYLDMVFCHYSFVDDEQNSLGDEHYLPLIARCDKLIQIYNNES